MSVVDGEMTPTQSIERLVAALQELRERAGRPGSRKIAARLGSVSHTTVAEALSGRRIPTWPVVASIVEGLGGDLRVFRPLWQTATNDTPTPTEVEREDAAFLARYRRLAASYYASMQALDFDRRRRASIDELYVPQTIVPWRVDAAEAVTGTGTYDFGEVVSHTVLLGDAGVGKSTLCQVLMHRYAKDSAGPVPYFISIRDFASTFPLPKSVVGHIEDRLCTVFQAQPPDRLIERQLLETNTLVIFDGLDELSNTAQRGDVASTIEMFAAEFPLARILVTSRPPGYEQTSLDPQIFTTFRLLEFGSAQAEQFVCQWFANEGAIARQGLSTDMVRELVIASDLPKSPLALALTCSFYERRGRVPANSAELYQAYWEQYVHRWDQSRGVRGARQLGPTEANALGYVALKMLSRPRPEASESELHRLTSEKMLEEVGNVQAAESTSRDLVEYLTGRASILREVGCDDRGEIHFSFFHQTLAEYAAAQHLVGMHETLQGVADALLQPLGRGEWHDLGVLVVQIVDRQWVNGGNQVVEYLISASADLDAHARRSLQDFLLRCVEILDLPSTVVAWSGVNDLGGNEPATGSVDPRDADDFIDSRDSLEKYVSSWPVSDSVPGEVIDALHIVRQLLIQAFDRDELKIVVANWGWATLEACIRGAVRDLNDEHPRPQLSVGSTRDGVPCDLLQLATGLGVIPKKYEENLRVARDIRNRAAHGGRNVDIDLRSLVESIKEIQVVTSGIYDPMSITARLDNRPLGPRLALERDRLEARREQQIAAFEEERLATQLARQKIEAELETERHDELEADLQLEVQLGAEKLKLDHYRAALNQGQYGALAAHLQEDPSSVEQVAVLLARQHDAETSQRIEALRLLLNSDEVEGWEISDKAKVVLGQLLDQVTAGLSDHVPQIAGGPTYSDEEITVPAESEPGEIPISDGPDEASSADSTSDSPMR